jgi:hypothetical protein
MEGVDPCFKNGEKGAGDRCRSGRPATAATTEIKDNDDASIPDGRRITTSELCAATGTGKLAVTVIISELGYRNSAHGGSRK